MSPRANPNLRSQPQRRVRLMATARRRWKRKDPHNERGRYAIRYRAYPTSAQRSTARHIAGCCRLVKNLAKDQRDLAWRLCRRSLSYSEQSASLKELRDDPKVASFLKEAPAQVLQQAILDLDNAYRHFFAGEAGYPTWARKSAGASFRDPQNVGLRRISQRWGEVKIQGVGRVRIRLHRPPVGSRICSATYVEEPDGKVFVSVLFEKRKRSPSRPKVASAASVVGVDRGVAVAVATSEGDLVDRKMWTDGELRRLRALEQRREQQRRSREPGRRRKSKSQEKTEHEIAALHARARRRRQDFTEQESNDLSKNHLLVVFENLAVKAMTASARGTVEQPGTNVRQKAGFNRAILDKGWGMLQTKTERKVLRHGHRTIEVPAPYTSVSCPVPTCGVVDPSSRATRSMFVCVSCGFQGHADTTASINIRERGIKLALAGGTPVAAHLGTNQEPASVGAEPSALAGRGSGNQEKGCITVGSVA